MPMQSDHGSIWIPAKTRECARNISLMENQLSSTLTLNLTLATSYPIAKQKPRRVTTEIVRVDQTPETTTGADLGDGGAGPTNYCDNLIFYLYAVIMLLVNVVSKLRDANSELQRSNKLLKAENNRLFLKLKTVEKQASN